MLVGGDGREKKNQGSKLPVRAVTVTGESVANEFHTHVSQGFFFSPASQLFRKERQRMIAVPDSPTQKQM